MKYIRLRDLETVVSEKVDIPKLMTEAYGFKKKGLLRSVRFTKCFYKVFADVNEVRSIDISKVELKPCGINVPTNIERIPYASMIHLQMLLKNENTTPLSELVAKVVSTVCFSSNVKQPFDTESIYFNWFTQKVLSQPIVEMFGIYNWICKSVIESDKKWDERFFSVRVDDEDYLLADNGRMAQFNVINTIKKSCQDFNVTEKDAWQLPFIMVQTNNYEGASRAFTQHQMSRLKEAKMKAERDRQNANL